MKFLKPLFVLTITALVFSACKKDDEYEATEIHTIPYGEEGTLESGDYSGDGLITNAAGTTVTVEGDVVVDDFSVLGKVIIPEGNSLTCNNSFTLGGGATLDIHGTLNTGSFSQVGNTYMTDAKMKITGKYTIGGGTTVYMENSEVEVSELVVVGHINGIENSDTRAKNFYNVFEFTGIKYLNRGGGTRVCGQVLFTTGTDLGASGASLDDATSEALSNNSAVRSAYGLSGSQTLYQYSDYCAGQSSMPSH